jgi:hypothetical protein
MSKYFKVTVTADSPYNVKLSQVYLVDNDTLGGYSGKGIRIAQKLISDYLKENNKKVTPRLWNKFTHKCKITFQRFSP